MMHHLPGKWGVQMSYCPGWRRSDRPRPGRITRAIVGLVLLLLLLFPAAGRAQETDPALQLGLRRDFGFGSGVQIQGIFSYLVSGPDDLTRVRFLLDGEVIGEDTEAPFRFRFNTGSYELGWHTLSAVGFTAGGRELASAPLQRRFVSGQAVSYIVIAVVVLVLGFRALSYYLTRQKGAGEPGAGYGWFGGAVCPHCGRPFARHWWAPNLLAGRFDRCPHCGKWSSVRRASPQALAKAEGQAGESEATAGAPTPETEEAALRRRLEASRFEDSR